MKEQQTRYIEMSKDRGVSRNIHLLTKRSAFFSSRQRKDAACYRSFEAPGFERLVGHQIEKHSAVRDHLFFSRIIFELLLYASGLFF